MSQFTTLSLTNGASAAVPFNPLNISYSNGVAIWKAQGLSFDVGRQASFSISVPTAKSSRCRIKAKIAVPVVDPLDANKKIDELIGNIEFVIPKNANLVSRQDLLAFVKSFLEQGLMEAAVEDFQGVY